MHDGGSQTTRSGEILTTTPTADGLQDRGIIGFGQQVNTAIGLQRQGNCCSAVDLHGWHVDDTGGLQLGGGLQGRRDIDRIEGATHRFTPGLGQGSQGIRRAGQTGPLRERDRRGWGNLEILQGQGTPQKFRRRKRTLQQVVAGGAGEGTHTWGLAPSCRRAGSWQGKPERSLGHRRLADRNHLLNRIE